MRKKRNGRYVWVIRCKSFKSEWGDVFLFYDYTEAVKKIFEWFELEHLLYDYGVEVEELEDYLYRKDIGYFRIEHQRIE